MSQIRTGFLLPDDSIIPVSSIEQLRQPKVQTLLQEYHYSQRKLRCLCCNGTGRPGEVVVTKVPESPTSELSVRYANRADHGPGCWLWKSYLPSLSIEMTWKDSIFRAKTSVKPETEHYHRQTGYESSDGPRTFEDFALQAFSKAQIRAFLKAREIERMPNSAETLSALDAELRLPQFTSGEAYQAARSEGYHLLVGIIPFEFSPQFDTQPDTIWCLVFTGCALQAKQYFIDQQLWLSSLKSCSVLGRPLPAPFISFILVDAQSRIVRMRMFACYSDGSHCIPCESQYEAAFAAHLLAKGNVFLKPLRKRDAWEVFTAEGLLPEGEIQALYRPDFVIRRILPSRELVYYILELRGFKKGGDLKYDQLLERKLEFYRSFPGWLLPVERNGWDYEKMPCSDLFAWSRLPIELAQNDAID